MNLAMSRPASPALQSLPRLESIEDVAQMVIDSGDVALYVRYSAGPDADLEATSRDDEAEYPLPGLIVSPLTPEPWWPHSAECWVAHQLCQYLDFESPVNDRFPWVLTGKIAGRGPRCELLVADVRPIASIDAAVVIKSLAQV